MNVTPETQAAADDALRALAGIKQGTPAMAQAGVVLGYIRVEAAHEGSVIAHVTEAGRARAMELQRTAEANPFSVHA